MASLGELGHPVAARFSFLAAAGDSLLGPSAVWFGIRDLSFNDDGRGLIAAAMIPYIPLNLNQGLSIAHAEHVRRTTVSERIGQAGLSPEQIKFLTEFANGLVWKSPDLEILKPDAGIDYNELVQILQDMMQKSNRRGRLILPNLTAHGNETVAVFSDYAGESSGDYHTYSFLTCGWNTCGAFLGKVSDIRAQSRLGDKEIAFKDFRMGQMQRALPDYLKAADLLLHGFLLTIVIDKKLLTLFGPNEKKTQTSLSETLRQAGLGTWKPDAAEKLLRVVHCVAFLVALLARSGQKVFWMSDNDTICANEDLHRQALDLLARAVGIYAQDSHFLVFSGAAPFKNRGLGHLDLLSLADITASSVEHYLTRKNANEGVDFGVKAGSHSVLQWLAHDGLSLSKMTIIVRPSVSGAIETANLEFKLAEEPNDVTAIPIVI
ncbi:hypothetical protein [Sinorhizobium terangae]|uniref:hypothetical protein n=1 Tax=Sinorhizobium terangae TaxID=110322 RepID=UPI0024B073CC|nr:hypothetical protein [Sinorhizobium terangae]WFU51791.1 hypothetical protein QA637_30485 [Sinorhizobium terangae]